MIYNRARIDPKDIINVLPHIGAVLLRFKPEYTVLARGPRDINIHNVSLHCLDDEAIAKFKFEHVKYLKTLPDPTHRVADFEYRDELGNVDFKRMDQIIESRKSREERDEEIQVEISLIKDLERLGFDIEFMREELKIKMQGG